MSRLYICEKPSQARDIASVIGIKGKGNGYIDLADGGVMTWAIGHLLSQKSPNEYKEEWVKWSFDQLPMVPEKFEFKKAEGRSAQLDIVGKLLKSVKEVIICTDAGREGEMIAREVLDWFKFKGSIQRLWLSSMLEPDIRKGLSALRPGTQYKPLYDSALARAYSDWLYGMNLTRAATLKNTARGVCNVGRVKTPTLAMVVKRDLEIDNFEPKDYFELIASVVTSKGHALTLSHAPSVDNRIMDKKVAQDLLNKAKGAQSPLAVVRSEGKEAAPFPHTLTTLQEACSSALGLSAADTLKVAQALYETHKVITYPRTDCKFLPAAHKLEISDTLKAVSVILPKAVEALDSVGQNLRKTLFDDSKLTDHHAIVPNMKKPSGLSQLEEKVYCLIAIRYLKSIAADCKFDLTQISMNANGVEFKTSGRVITFEGHRAIS